MEYAPRKVPVPKGGDQMQKFTVKHYHLDVYHHVNNGQYIQWRENSCRMQFYHTVMRAEYKSRQCV